MKRALAFLAVLLAVVLAGCNPTPVDVPVRTISAAQFHDSVGLNVHDTYFNTTYGNWDRTLQDVNSLGVPRLRVGIFDSANAGWNAVHWTNIWKAANQHLKLNVVMNTGCSYLGIDRFDDCFAILQSKVGLDWVSSIEWPNESSDPRLPVWGQDIYNRAHYLGKPVYGPSLTNASTLGDQSPRVDFGNLHDYTGATSPTPQSVQADKARQVPIVGSKPAVATEFGYYIAKEPTQPYAQPGINENGQAIYILRQLFEHLAQNVDHSFIYELYDETAGVGSEQNFGLIRADLTWKPAANALRNTLAAIGNDAPTNVAPLQFQIEKDDLRGDVRYLDIAKGDGSHELVLWRTASVWNRDSQQPIAVAPTPIHIYGHFKSWDWVDPVTWTSSKSTGTQPLVQLGADPILIHIVP